MTEKHLPRNVTEFQGRHNRCPLDTERQLRMMAKEAKEKLLRYADLSGPEETRQPRML